MNASVDTLPMSKKTTLLQLVPVMLCFFAMGFVDLIGTASNYVKDQHSLTESEAGYLPLLVFFWFLIISVPTGILMNKIGRKKTVLLSLVVTTLALIIPICGDSLALFVIGFSLLGIGNAIMQTSLNPLVTNLIADDKLASTLTFGQFVKAIASFLAPIIMTWGYLEVFPTFGLGWRGLFALYAIISFLSIAVLGGTPIKEEKPDKASGLLESVKLLGFPFVFLCFMGIFCHVGIDVGVNTYAPKIIMERLAVPLEEATFATSLYFIFRTGGTFLGSFFLRMMSQKIFFLISVLMMLASMVILFSCHSLGALYTGIALVGFGNSNIFAVVFSQALNNRPKERNEVSGLMIMGLFGGAIFPVVMSYFADFFGGVSAAVMIMTIGVVYLLFFTFIIKQAKETKEEKEHPTNWYPWAIGSIVCGFLASGIGCIFGIIAMKKAKQANLYFEQEDYQNAKKENSLAKIYTYIGYICAAAGIVVLTIFFFPAN